MIIQFPKAPLHRYLINVLNLFSLQTHEVTQHNQKATTEKRFDWWVIEMRV